MEDDFTQRELREVEIKVAGRWTPCKFSDVVKGDTFRLFESTGEPVVLPDGLAEFIASDDAVLLHGKWVLETKDDEE